MEYIDIFTVIVSMCLCIYNVLYQTDLFFLLLGVPRDPLEQNFFVIQNNPFYLMPMQGPYEFLKDEDKNKIVESSSLSPEIEVQVADESVEFEEMCTDGKDKVNLASEIYNKI